jgi:hypothetical protein
MAIWRDLDLGKNYLELLKFYWAPAICLGVGVGTAVLLPLSCLIFFLCRVCGKCGKNAYEIEEFEEKGDMCKRGLLNIFLFLVILLIA